MIGVDVDISDVEKGLRKLAGFEGHELRDVLKDLRKPMRADQRAHAKAQEGSDGKWAPRARSTLEALARRKRSARRARKAGLKRRSLARAILGRLPGAINVRIEGKAVVARGKPKWSGAHQDGGRVGHDAELPAREYLWISDSMLEAAANTVGDRLARAWGP